MPRHHRLSVLAAAVVSCSLAGCSRTPTPVSVTSAASSPATPVAGARATATSAVAGSAGPAGSPESVHRCEPATLSLSVVFPGGADPGGALLQFVNTGAAACRMKGFPGVDLLGPDDPAYGPTYQVPRAAGAAPTVTLAPGSTAHAVLHFLAPQEGPRWIPARISVTPPDTTGQLASPWPRIAVLRQDAATHPGTYIGPVLAGAGSLTEIR